MNSWHNDVKYSIAKAFVDGAEKYQLWKGDTQHGVFDERLAALNHAETLL